MFWNKYFWPSFVVLLLITTLHWFGFLYDYYSDIWWYDIILHFLGGLWVFLFTLWFLFTQYIKKLLDYVSIRDLVFFVLIVGISWEIFELIMGFESISNKGYISDTLLDLIMDIIGATIGSLFYKK
jgi:hypothetical protein